LAYATQVVSAEDERAAIGKPVIGCIRVSIDLNIALGHLRKSQESYEDCKSWTIHGDYAKCLSMQIAAAIYCLRALPPVSV
jgi:hypothetical protein